VATSSQISRTSCARHAFATAATNEGGLSSMPAAPCTSGSRITAANDAACSSIAATAASASPAATLITGKRSGSSMSVPKPPSPTDRDPMVSPW
jgi:hypothetical protein